MGSMKVSAVVSLVVAACSSGPRPTAPAAPPPSTATPAPARPARAPVPARLLATVDAPVGDVRVAIYAGEIYDGRRCWTFVTDGLLRRLHPEIVLTILQRAADDPARYPDDVVELLGQIATVVPTRTRFDAWGSGTVGSGLLGRDDVIGLAAIPAEAPAGVDVPRTAVTLLPLTRDETEVARLYGAPRVAAVLGQHERYYPTISWFDRDRATSITAADVTTTVLDGMPGVRWPDISILLDVAELGNYAGATLRVRVEPGAIPRLVELLRSGDGRGGSALLLLEPDELAGNRLVWLAGSQEPGAIHGPPSRRITGNFLVLTVGAERGSSLVEDGVVLNLTVADRDAVVAALEAGRDHVAGGKLNRPWTVEIVRKPSPRYLRQTTFRTPLDDLPRRFATGDLVLFTEQLERELSASPPPPPGLTQITVEVILRPGAREARVTAAGAARDPWMDALERRIAALPEVLVADEVAVDFELSLSPPAAPAPRP